MTRAMAGAVARFLQQHGIDAQVASSSSQMRTPRDAWGVQVNDIEHGPLFAITGVVSLHAVGGGDDE